MSLSGQFKNRPFNFLTPKHHQGQEQHVNRLLGLEETIYGKLISGKTIESAALNAAINSGFSTAVDLKNRRKSRRC